MSQQDTKDVRDTQGREQPVDDSDVTKVDWFTIVVVILGGIVGIACFAQMIIEGFYRK